jgi:hypothetical protein
VCVPFFRAVFKLQYVKFGFYVLPLFLAANFESETPIRNSSFRRLYKHIVLGFIPEDKIHHDNKAIVLLWWRIHCVVTGETISVSCVIVSIKNIVPGVSSVAVTMKRQAVFKTVALTIKA